MKKLTQRKADKIVKNHKIWLDSLGVRGKRAEFVGFSIKGVTFEHVSLSRARFWDCFIDESSFIGVRLTETDFSTSVLRRTVFYESDLRFSSFWKSVLQDTHAMPGCFLHCIDFRGTTIDNKCTFLGNKQYMLRVDGLGYSNDSAIYIPDEDRVFMGWAIGSLDKFYHYEIKRHKGSPRELIDIELAYRFFKNHQLGKFKEEGNDE